MENRLYREEGSWETSQESIEVILWGDDFGLIQDSSSGGGEMLNWGYNLKVGLTGFVTDWTWGTREREESRMTP